MNLSPTAIEIKLADLKSEILKLSAKIDYICLVEDIDIPISISGEKENEK